MVSLLVLLAIPSFSALIGMAAVITVQTLCPRLKDRPRRVIEFPGNKEKNVNPAHMEKPKSESEKLFSEPDRINHIGWPAAKAPAT